MPHSTLMPEEDLSTFSWVGMTVPCTKLTFTVLIPKRLLNSPIYKQAIGSLLKDSNRERLESGLLIIDSLPDIKAISLNHFFVVPRVAASVILVKYRGGTGHRRQNWLLIMYELGGSLDQPLPPDLLHLLSSFMSKGEYSKAKVAL